MKMKRIIVSVLCMFVVVTFMPLSTASAATNQSRCSNRYATNMTFRGHFNCGDQDNAIYLVSNSNTGSKIANVAKMNCEISEFNIANGSVKCNNLSEKTGMTKLAKRYVYITRTGKRYHRIKRCRGLSRAKRIYKVSLKTAKAYGLTKCKICW